MDDYGNYSSHAYDAFLEPQYEFDSDRYGNFSDLDEEILLDGDIRIPSLGNIRVWELAGCFLGASIILSNNNH
jgi:hypothetical protein